MAGLQRSEISFRRQGSSGLIWDDKLISEELNSDKPAEEIKPGGGLKRSSSDGGGRRSNYRTVKVDQVEDPPSPRVSACGFCSVFSKPADVETHKKRKAGHKVKRK